jgi:hypothetical protein
VLIGQEPLHRSNCSPVDMEADSLQSPVGLDPAPLWKAGLELYH